MQDVNFNSNYKPDKGPMDTNSILTALFSKLETLERKVDEMMPKLDTLIAPKKKREAKVIPIDYLVQAEKYINRWNEFVDSNKAFPLRHKNLKLALKNNMLIFHINQRHIQEDFDFEKILKITRLCRKESNWLPDFDFIFESPYKWPKIIEGKYLNRDASWVMREYHDIINESQCPTPIKLQDIRRQLENVG